MSKYYTPEIEEFHPGFEYEWCREIGDSPYNTPWTKKTFTKKDSYHELWLNTPAARDSDCGTYYRVKHLDRSDIESLEWEYKETTEGKYDYFWDKGAGKHSILYSETQKRCLVTIRNEVRKEDFTAFVGTIKNKSELKRLLKQLGI